MGVQGRIVIAAAAGPRTLAAAEAAFSRLDELEWAISSWRPRSGLHRGLAAAGRTPGTPAAVEEDLARVLAAAQRMAAATGGAFDATCGPLVELWRETRRTGRRPAPDALAAARGRTDWTRVSAWLEPDRTTADAEVPAVGPSGSPGPPRGRMALRAAPGHGLPAVDFGGIGKGAAADAGLRALRSAGIASALVAIGGDLAAGDPPAGEPGWRVALAGGRTVLLARAAASTSGDTEQWALVDGQRYAHVVDVRTGLGHRHRREVSVVADRAMVADALASALYALGPEAALPLLVRHRAAAIFAEGGPITPEAAAPGPSRGAVRVVVLDPWSRLVPVPDDRP